ncbi:fibronectin type III domain-containing protein [Phycisphaerales bacterium AB-hyl4]|uniref:Fibronectin type III domain-containing protein n=1 Tax=Natronomicrosphaera hydrolytica TaxID=3242702 RepID=A0ABV4UA19_9BACT
MSDRHRSRSMFNHTMPVLLAGVIAFLAAAPVLADDMVEYGKILVDFDSTWRYHDGDVDLGTAWLDPDYDDSDWNEGPGLLGYDTRDRNWPGPGLQTELEEYLITYYFRKSFDYDGSTDGVSVRLDQIIDDGAVYYLNGEEIGRTEWMPEGDVGFGTATTRPINPSLETGVFEFDASKLRQGRNVLAVSVHNNGRSSSDICFGMRLIAAESLQTPVALLLTWQQDPTTTMTVIWHSKDENDTGVIEYAPLGNDADHATAEVSRQRPMPYSDRHIYIAEITGLEPGSDYQFRIRRDAAGENSPHYRFRTMPAEADRPIRFAAGGDTRQSQPRMERTNRVAMQYDIEFVVWGGDFAYADGQPERVDRWYEWFDANMNTLIDDDGRVVPVIPTIGNHEVRGGYYWGQGRGEDAYEDSDAFREEIAPYYYSLFPFPGHPGYAMLDFGDYMSLVLLDSDHTTPIGGEQTSWLEQQLADRQDVPHVFPVYHVPGFPSHRSYDSAVHVRVREHWVPLFEQYDVRVAFENHDHTYKRTVPIRDGEQADDGVVYLGDGAWGVGTREPHDVNETWYLERAEAKRHAIIVTIHGESQDFKAIDENGKLIDHHISRPRH